MATTVTIEQAPNFALLKLTLPPRPLRRDRHRRRGRHPPSPVQEALRLRSHTRCHIRRKRRHRPPPLHPIQYPTHSRIQDRWTLPSPLFQETVNFRTALIRTATSLSLGRTP